MKGLMLRKVTFASFLIVVSYNVSEIGCTEQSIKVGKVAQSARSYQLYTEDEIINQAVDKFKHKIQNKGGHLQKMSCRFKMLNGQKLETNLKTYFSNYRRKPDYETETHATAVNLQPDSVIEVIYIKHNQSLSVIYKDGREKKRLLTKQVDLPVGFSA